MKLKNIMYYIATFILFSGLFMINVYAWCPLGEDVTKDLYGVLKIFRIAAPLLVIVYTVMDVIQTVTKGEIAAEGKKIAQKFGKRALYAVLLFFLPILIDQAMQIADVWGVNGTCDLEAPSNNGHQTGEELFGDNRTEDCKIYDKKPNECIAAGCNFIQSYCVAKPNQTESTAPTGTCSSLSLDKCSLRTDCIVYADSIGPRCGDKCENLDTNSCLQNSDRCSVSENGECFRK